MANDNWDSWGKDLDRIVDEAIHSGNYGNLSGTVADTINQAIDEVSKAVNNTVDQIFPESVRVQIPKEYWDRVAKPNASPDQIRRQRQAAARRAAAAEGRQSAPDEPGRATAAGIARDAAGSFATSGSKFIESLKYFKSNVSLKVSGILKTVFGGIFSIGGIGVFTDFINYGDFSDFLISIAFMVGFGYMLGSGIYELVGGKRYKKYKEALEMNGDQGYISIDDLAAFTDLPRRTIIKDLKKMIKKRWFKEGHLDQNETTFIATNEMYKLYLDAQRSAKQRAASNVVEREQKTEKKKAETRKNETEAVQNESDLPEEVREILTQGRTYIREIHEANDRIPGEEISEKISRMEDITKNIFARVEEHPELADNTKRLMNYYLPLTVKLLNAYADMDQQKYSGENIENSKREIEETIDTLNDAFEQMLDDLYKVTAWDVASDISVLNTILKREGLGEKDFKEYMDAAAQMEEEEKMQMTSTGESVPAGSLYTDGYTDGYTDDLSGGGYAAKSPDSDIELHL